MDTISVKNCATVADMRQKLDRTAFRRGSKLARRANCWTGYVSPARTNRLANHTFSYQDYAQDKNVKLPEPHGIFFSLQEELEKENQEQRELSRKWNNKKNDALSVYAFATWSGPADVFVTADKRDIIRNREKLKAPYMVKVARPVEVPGNLRILQESIEEIPGHIVIPGHILTPQEAVEYLQTVPLR